MLIPMMTRLLSNWPWSPDIICCLKVAKLVIHFCRQGGLSQHEKAIHEGKSFECKQCKFQTGYASSLLTHVDSIHNEKKYGCNHCDYKATQQVHLNRHKESLHMGIKFECSQCNSQFSDKRGLIYHTIDS